MEALPHGEEIPSEIENMSLKYLFEQLDLNAKKARWLAFFSEYHFKLKHIKGKENKICIALRRRSHMIYEVTLSQNDLDLHYRIRTTNRVALEEISTQNRPKKKFNKIIVKIIK